MASKLGVKQLADISKRCRRWAALEALPAAVREKFEELEILSAHLERIDASGERPFRLVTSLKASCTSLKKEFSDAAIAFHCPACPLRPPGG